MRRALRRVEDVPCAVVEPLLRTVAAPAPALHVGFDVGGGVPEGAVAGDVEGVRRRLPKEHRRALRPRRRESRGGVSEGRAPGRPPRQPRQHEALGPEPGDQGRGHIRGAGALPGVK